MVRPWDTLGRHHCCRCTRPLLPKSDDHFEIVLPERVWSSVWCPESLCTETLPCSGQAQRFLCWICWSSCRCHPSASSLGCRRSSWALAIQALRKDFYIVGERFIKSCDLSKLQILHILVRWELNLRLSEGAPINVRGWAPLLAHLMDVPSGLSC